MSSRMTTILSVGALVAFAAPAVAQDAYQDQKPKDAVEERADHDWEFALAASQNAPGATGKVKVKNGADANKVKVIVSDLPAPESLTPSSADDSAYTIWIVPGRDRVRESTLAGVIEVDAEGEGVFETTTELDRFGVVVLATTEEPTEMGGVAVLTGIPAGEPGETVTAEEPAAPTAGGVDESPSPVDEEGPDERGTETMKEPQ